MLLVGLTGGIATGKSTLARIFRENGIVVVDADEAARKVEPGTTANALIRKEFGDEYFDENGNLKRQKLGALVFDNEEKRRKLNSIVHPAVRKYLILEVLKAFVSLQAIVGLDIPLLFESRLDNYVHRIVVVDCSEEEQKRRIVARDGLSMNEAQARMACQMPGREKVRRATYVIDNNGTLENTTRQVEEVIRLLRSSWQPCIVKTSIILVIAAIVICIKL